MPRLSKRATLIREYESLAELQVIKAYVQFCFDNEDSFEDNIDYCILAELAVLKSSWYHIPGSYRQWDSNWEWMLQDMYMTDDEFLSNFHMDRSCVMQLNRLVENDEAFRNVYGK